MKITMSGKGFEISDSLRERVEKKLAKLDRYFREDVEANVRVAQEKGNRNIVEITIAVNGLILPITLLVILLASRRKDIVGEDYKHPTVLIVLGVCVVLLTGYSGIKALPKILTIFG